MYANSGPFHKPRRTMAINLSARYRKLIRQTNKTLSKPIIAGQKRRYASAMDAMLHALCTCAFVRACSRNDGYLVYSSCSLQCTCNMITNPRQHCFMLCHRRAMIKSCTRTDACLLCISQMSTTVEANDDDGDDDDDDCADVDVPSVCGYSMCGVDCYHHD